MPNYEMDKKCQRDIPGWKEYWYSPKCRSWFTDAKKQWETKKETPRGFMSDPYEFAGDK